MMAETYVIGPGIEEAMRQYADEPKGDEKPLSEDYQAAPGRDRLYIYSKQANQVYVSPKVDAPTPTARVFGVWNGVTLLHTLGTIFSRVRALTPPGDWQPAWYPKAGEGGTWQRALSDPNGLTGEAMLRDWVRQGAATGVGVIPYVVVRGRAEWNTAEWDQIAACVRAAGWCILNLEPGTPYWNGGTDADAGRRYLHGLAARTGVGKESLELCAIPRTTQINELGGPETLKGWLEGVSRASWECYEDSPAPALAPGYAIPHVVQPLTSDPLKQIPLIQRSMIDRYHDSEWLANGGEVWHLDGS
jgi:hypothetical protein